MKKTDRQFKCVIHGSFRKHWQIISDTAKIFTNAGITVLAPDLTRHSDEKDGFTFFEGEENLDPRLIELNYLNKLRLLGENGFSYFVNPDGYMGISASYEFGIAQTTNTRCLFMHRLKDHPAYVPRNSIWSPKNLAEYISENNSLPKPKISRDEKLIHLLWQRAIVSGALVAAGAIIEYVSTRYKEPLLLFVKTDKWGGRYSVVGERIRRNETTDQALIRGVYEETGLEAEIGTHLCTFDQIKNSGYYLPGQMVFVDKAVRVKNRRVRLDKREASEYIWIPAKEALSDLPLEPNARHTLELYLKSPAV